MTMSPEEPAGRRATRALLVGTWATGALYLGATPAPYGLKLPLMVAFVAVQFSNIAQLSRLRDIRLTSTTPRFRAAQRWREDAARAGWPLVLTVGLTFTSIAMLLAGAVITFLGGASS